METVQSKTQIALQPLLHPHEASEFKNAHILVDGYDVLLYQWSLAKGKIAGEVLEPNKVYVEQVQHQINRLLTLQPKSITFYLDAVVTRPYLDDRIRHRQKLLSTIDFDGLITPRLLTSVEIKKHYPKVNMALCDMETAHIILNDIQHLKTAANASENDLYLILSDNLMICEYTFTPNEDNVFIIPANEDQDQWTEKFNAYSYKEIQNALFPNGSLEILPAILGNTRRNPTDLMCRKLEFENSVIHNNCPVIMLPVIPAVEGLNPFDVGSVYRRCAYGSFLNEFGLQFDMPISIYYQESRQYKAHPLRPLDRSICKAHANYWSQKRRGTDFCDELIGFVKPEVITPIGRYLNDLIAGRPMRATKPNLESKNAISYLAALFYSLCVLGECEFRFPTDRYMELLTGLNPSHLASYLS